MTGTNAEIKADRKNLIAELERYAIGQSESDDIVSRFLDLLVHPQCFYRDCFPGHITGSAILLNVTGDQILMNHHKSLDKWLSFGGHADGDEDILSVAIRETMEESGITAFKPISADFIDLDIHEIPANSKKNEPEHCHYDVRYVMQMTERQKPVMSEESLNLKWMTFDEALAVGDDSMCRLIKKVRDNS